MLAAAKGFALFISVERGFMLLMITAGSAVIMAPTLNVTQIIHLGLTVFLGWSGVDAINNIFDKQLDETSDKFRANFTKKLGSAAYVITIALLGGSLTLGYLTQRLEVPILVLLGILCSIIYSVPPLRLRQTILKPVVNISVGSIPVLIVTAFYRVFSLEASLLSLAVGMTTGVNSLWEDLADYASDLMSGARTAVVVLGYRRGIYLTIVLGYLLVPPMVLAGYAYGLPSFYYWALLLLCVFMLGLIYQRRKTLFGTDQHSFEELGKAFARDFVLIAITATTNLFVSGYARLALG